MADDHDKDDEHYAPESGEPDTDNERGEDAPDPLHDADDEHYAPES
jgi:hypothetical protein